MQLIVLWDVDHTLVDNAGVSKEIYASAFKDLAGRDAELPAPTEGRTDRAIMREMFAQHGLPVPQWESAQRALEKAGRGREEDLRRRGRVLPGVQEALKALATDSEICSSVLTGNIAANARVKLGAFGLDGLLDMPVGGYGEDSEDRARLVDAARARIHAAYGVAMMTPTVLIGDTPRDVRAAHDAEARCIAVASGIHSVAELRAAGADFLLPELTDTDGLLAHLRAAAA
ncbi:MULTISPECIES: HAD family hydrolase [Streptomyces]|uniref:Haloacid dehalogenase n=1 Tax=Streptomyces dengpaensis TaxID=2049881 RepID=A0ABN5HWK9_9ACTN|nr:MULTISPECIES: HAD hydrolase-like protein [Streptomyces]AVH55541.1 haloacid dehalogenase [Streptomyces dengpaensis]PIB11803.1 haloacid dehalogenase [Streptomyces sp. HG99]